MPLWTHLGAILGPIWSQLGRVEAPLEDQKGAAELSEGVLSSKTGAIGAPKSSRDAIWSSQDPIGVPFGCHLGGPGDHFGARETLFGDHGHQFGLHLEGI